MWAARHILPHGPADWLLLPASFQYAIRRAEYLLRARLWDRVAVKPVLNIPATELRTGQVQGIETQERNCFGFDFSQGLRRLLAVVKLKLGGVAEFDMAHFMKQGFVRHRSNRRDSNFSLARIALHVAVGFRERGFDYIQRGKCFCLALCCHLRHWNRLPIRLRQHKPPWLVDECGDELLGFAAVVFLLGDERHTERQGTFTLPHLPAKLLPAGISVNRSRLHAGT